MAQKKKSKPELDFDPKIVAFCCNWCSYPAADGAGVNRIQYPPNVRIIRVMCGGRVNPSFVLKAFEMGADGVMVAT
jgi:F420-non-reducing hydrogenase iron-sulfur subunit